MFFVCMYVGTYIHSRFMKASRECMKDSVKFSDLGHILQRADLLSYLKPSISHTGTVRISKLEEKEERLKPLLLPGPRMLVTMI